MQTLQQKQNNPFLSLLSLLIFTISNGVSTFVVGPNLFRKNQHSPRWSFRASEQTGDQSIPIDSVCMQDVRTMSADSEEAKRGCTYRLGGRIVEREAVKNDGRQLVPLRFDEKNGNFYVKNSIDGDTTNPTHPNYVVFERDGQVLGILGTHC